MKQYSPDSGIAQRSLSRVRVAAALLEPLVQLSLHLGDGAQLHVEPLAHVHDRVVQHRVGQPDSPQRNLDRLIALGPDPRDAFLLPTLPPIASNLPILSIVPSKRPTK